MIKLKDILREDYNLDDHPKKKWIQQPLTSIDKRIMDELFKMYSAVYSAEGLQLSAFSASELQAGYDIVMLIDIDRDPMPDAFIFTSNPIDPFEIHSSNQFVNEKKEL